MPAAVDPAVFALIPIVAIVAKFFRDWLRLSHSQKALGASNSELQQEVTQLQKERSAILERLQNLEAIVVSQTWEAVNDRSLPAPERELRMASTVRKEVAGPSAESLNQQRAEQLAQRLRG